MTFWFSVVDERVEYYFLIGYRYASIMRFVWWTQSVCQWKWIWFSPYAGSIHSTGIKTISTAHSVRPATKSTMGAVMTTARS